MDIIIERLSHAVPRQQLTQMLLQKLIIKRVRMIEVLLGALFEGKMRHVAVVAVLLDNEHTVWAEGLLDLLGDQSFT
jgi:hypothetical protein